MEPIIWTVQCDTGGWDGPTTVEFILACSHYSKDLSSTEEIYQANIFYVN